MREAAESNCQELSSLHSAKGAHPLTASDLLFKGLPEERAEIDAQTGCLSALSGIKPDAVGLEGFRVFHFVIFLSAFAMTVSAQQVVHSESHALARFGPST